MAAGPGDSGGLVDDLVVAVSLDDAQLTTGVRSGESAMAALTVAVRALDTTIRKVGEGFGVLSAAAVQMGVDTTVAGEKATTAIEAVESATKSAGDASAAAGTEATQAFTEIAEGATIAEQNAKRVASMFETLEGHAASLATATEAELRAFGAVRTINEENAATLGANAEQLARLSALYDAVAAKAEARAAADREAALAAQQAAQSESVAGPITGGAGAPVQTEAQRAQVDALIVKYRELAAATDAASAESVAAFQSATAAATTHANALNATDAQLGALKTAYTQTAASVSAFATAQRAAEQTANAASIQARVSALQAEAETVTIVGTSSVRAFREARLGAEGYIVALGATTEQLAALDAAEARVIQRAEQMGIRGVTEAGNIAAAQTQVSQRYGTAAIAIAGATDQMVRQGEAGGRALKSFISAGAQAAFMFGPEGAIAGAIAITALAIVDYFRRADKEGEAAIDRLEKRIIEMRQRALGGPALFDFTKAVAQLEDANRRVIEANKALNAATTVGEGRGGGKDSAADADRLEAAAKLKTALADVAHFTDLVRVARKDVADQGEKDAHTEASSLASLISLRQATAGQIERAHQLEAQFRAEIQKTTGADHESIETRARAAAGLKALEDAFNGVTRASDRNAHSLELVRDRAADTVARFSEQFVELQRAAEGGKSENIVAPFDRFIDAIEKAKRAIPSATEQLKLKPEVVATYKALGDFLDQLTPRVKALRTEAADRAVVSLFAELNKQIAEFSSSKLDDFDLKIQEVNKSTEERIKATTADGSAQRAAAVADLERVKTLQAQARTALTASENVDKLFRAIDQRTADGFLTPEELKKSNDGLDQEQISLATTLAALGEVSTTSKAYLDIQKLLLEVEKKRKELGDAFAKQNPFKIPGTNAADEKRDDEERIARQLRLVQIIGNAANSALNLAKAFHLVNDATAQVLRNVVDIGVGIGELFKAKSAGDKISAGLQIASSATAIIASIISDPTKAQRDKDLADNTLALRDLATHLGDLLKVSESGKTVSTITGGVEQLLAATGSEGGFHKLEGEGQFLEHVTGLSFKEIDAVAKELGITLDGTKQSYLDFLKALKGADMAAFLDTFAGALAKIDALDRAKGITDPLTKLQERIDLLNDKDKGAPAIAKALEGLDISNADSRAKAIQQLIDVLNNVQNLKPEDLGGLNLQEFIDQILNTIDGLRGLNPAALTPLQQFQQRLKILSTALDASGADAATRLSKLIEFFSKEFPDQLKDISPASSLTDVRQKFLTFLSQAASDGTISDSEQAVIDAFSAIVAAMQAAADAAGQTKTQAEQDAAAARQLTVTRAKQNLDLNGVTDPAAVQDALLKAYEAAIPKLGDILGHTAGDTLQAKFAEIFKELNDGSIAADSLGVPLDEFIAALLDIASAGKTATSAIKQTADALSQAFSDIDLNARIFGTSGSDALGQKLQAFGIASPDLASESGRASILATLRAQAQTADNATKQLIAQLVEAVSALTPAPASGGSETGGGSTSVQGAVQTATIAQADQLIGLETTQVSLLRQILDAARAPGPAIADAIRTLAGSALPTIVPPPVATSQRAVAAGSPAAPRPVAISISDGAVRLEVNNYGSVTQAEGVVDDASLRALARRLWAEIQQLANEASVNLGTYRPAS